MKRGWIKLHRAIFDSGLHTNKNAFILWVWILTHATHRPHRQLVGNQVVDLEPGQLVVGREALANSLCMSEQNIRTAFRVLKNAGNLTSKPTNKFSIVTVVNWGVYQGGECEANQQTNQQLTSNQPATNQQLTTNKNGENEKNGGSGARMKRPSIQELQAYFTEKGCTQSDAEAEKFFDYYESIGWKVGKNAMKDWKAAVRNWIKRNAGQTKPAKTDEERFKGYRL